MKNTIVACTLIFFSWSLSAQNDIQFGFELSPTVSWLSTDDNKINPNGSNLGLKLGMIGEFFFQENYSISTGIGFHFNAGGKLFYEESIDSLSIWPEAGVPGDDVYDGGTDFKYSIQYVEVPIGLKMRTREFGYLRYYVEPRLTMGFRTQAKGNVFATGIDSEEDYDIQSAVNLLNLSWGFGGGVEYTVSSNTAIVGGIAYQSGFTDVTKDKNTSITVDGNATEENSKGKFNSIILRLGVMF